MGETVTVLPGRPENKQGRRAARPGKGTAVIGFLIVVLSGLVVIVVAVRNVVVAVIIVVAVPFGMLSVHVCVVVVRVIVIRVAVKVTVAAGAFVLSPGNDPGNAEGADQGDTLGQALHGFAPGKPLVSAGADGTGSVLIPFVIHCLSPQESTPTRCSDGTMDLIDLMVYCSGTIGEKPMVSYQYCRHYTRDGAAVSRAFSGRGGRGIIGVDKREIILSLHGGAVCHTGDAGR